jgi:PDZ domain-containing protein
VRRLRRLLVATALVGATSAAWWSGALPCALVTTQPACQLAVSGGPVIDASTLMTLGPGGAGGDVVTVREPAGRLLVTTIEVWEPDGVSGWWAALRDPAIDLVARSLLVPEGGDLEDVARTGRARMEESQTLAVGLALSELGLIGGPSTPAFAWPVEVRFASDEVGGPSAGLMLALSVLARVAPEDPTLRLDGAAVARPPVSVAGTGALEGDGGVVQVGGVEHKLRSVVADARGGPLPDAFLLPFADLPVARRTILDRDLLLVPVRDLGDAVAALEALARGDEPADAVLVVGAEGTGR